MPMSPETKQVKRHMLLWLDNLDLGAIARFVQYEIILNVSTIGHD